MPRLLSLDAFRGFVILAMIWVNYIAGMPGIPAWLEHAGPAVDELTVPDLVFPGFLFIVGMAIPLALQRQLGQFTPALAGRLLWRAASLMVAGVVLANAYRYDADAALLPRATYFLLFYVAMILLWRQPAAPSPGRPLPAQRRPWAFMAGAGLMIFLLLSFRGTLNAEFSSIYLQHAWWGILGMIGWAYFAASLAYLATNGRLLPLVAVFIAMLALRAADPALPASVLNIPQVLGATAANVVAGTLAGILLQQRRMGAMALLAAALLAAGFLLRPYHGINKIQATECYTLVSSGIVLSMYLLFYWLIDVKKWKGWAALLLPAGANALLAYILPDLWEQAAAVLHAPRVWWPFLGSGGMLGMINAAAMTLFILLLVALANRAGLKLKF